MALASVVTETRAAVDRLFAILQEQGQGDYLGERVTQLEHSLQCARLAEQSAQFRGDLEVILAALLHDIGRFIPAAEKMEKIVGPDGAYLGRLSHEVLGENYLRQLGFSERICVLVGAHVMAKRYLVATDEEYYARLSATSKRSLQYQVHPVMTSGGAESEASCAPCPSLKISRTRFLSLYWTSSS